jgi:dTDP-4-amino-4,6-dideoxy-D-galactose acyltransferase
MKIEYKVKQWDSKFFGYKVGEAIIKEYDKIDFMKLKKIFYNINCKLVYLYPDSEKVLNELSDSNIPLLDTKIIFYKNRTSFNKNIKLYPIESYYIDDQYEKLIKLVFMSGKFSRYRIDTNFKRNEFEKLYKEWIDKSLKRIIADDVLVYKTNNKIIGFVTYVISELKLTIGLMAVDSDYQGKGIGKTLMDFIENVAYKKKLKEINVATQFANIEACDFYKACNYKMKSKKEIYHLWIS